jgi:hypothetical protein
MKSGKRLVIEAVVVPLLSWVIIWMLLYIHPTSNIRRENFNVSWLIITAVSLFLVLAFIIFVIEKHLRKIGYTTLKFKELPKVLEKIDPDGIKDLVSGIFRTVLLWGAFSSGVLVNGPKKGVILALDFALAFLAILLPLMVSMLIPIMEVPFLLYEVLTGKRLSYIFKEILLISSVSGGLMVFSGLMATYPRASEIAIIRSLLKLYADRELYRGLLMLAGLNALYGLTGILILPRKRRLGFLMLLLIATVTTVQLVRVFIILHS